MTQASPNPARPDDARGPRFRYTAALADQIELKWQLRWEADRTYVVPNPGDEDFDDTRPKFYCLDMFPYPSGAGLHVGHPEGYTATDIICRYKRMRGFNVLHPMGYDAFGLPAEQYAIQTGVHPAITTKKSIENFRRQLKRFGFCYDWSREVATIDPEYYHWTQWIFLRLYNAWYDADATRHDGGIGRARPISELIHELEHGILGVNAFGEVVALNGSESSNVITGGPIGIRQWHELTKDEQRRVIDNQRLAYIGEQTVNWCPKLGTVLANDEVIDGRSERGGYPVLRKPLKQWMFRITSYAERLLADLDQLDWPESTRIMQREWIGRSEGAEIDFALVTEVGRTSGPTSESPFSEVKRFDDPAYQPSLTFAGFVSLDPYPPGKPTAKGLIEGIRNLPHLELPQATYFVTWRTKQDIQLGDGDRDLVFKALLHWNDDRCTVVAASVMPDHVHWIVRPHEGQSLTDLVASVKRFAATQVNTTRHRHGPLWQEDRFDHIIRDHAWLGSLVSYVARNPVEAGLSSSVLDYPWTFLSQKLEAADSHSVAWVHPRCREFIAWRDESDENVGTECRPTSLRVYTTRPDTIFGATYMVIAPEHPLVEALLSHPTPETNVEALKKYVTAARNRSDVERQESKDKTGVFTGVYAENPATGQSIPVWTADYVLTGYGTGAIMAVPAHDQRDYEFAEAFKLPIRDVIYPRLVLAMRYFAEHARDEERSPEAWVSHLAEFLGLLTSLNAGHERFEEVLERVRRRRDGIEAEEAWEAAVDALLADAGGTNAAIRRGSNKAVWLDAVEQLKLDSPSELRQRFDNAQFYAQAGAAFSGHGHAVNSSNAEITIEGLGVDAAKEHVIHWLSSKGVGSRKINYRLRDWTFSRQRYWGEPFPIVYDENGNHYPVSDKALPVKLPELADYAPIESDDPLPLLAKASDWMNTTAGSAGVDPRLLAPETRVTRETNTMPGSAGSSWYFLRYCDAHNHHRFASHSAEQYWMRAPEGKIGGVDFYIGGSEHAVGHLLYSRFWHKVLYDLGEVSTPEPFQRLFHQGLITSFSFQRADKTLVPNDEVEEKSEGVYVERATGKPVTPVIAKMSKSLKNVVNPDDVIAEFGADTFRLYEMFMGPLEQSKPWNPRDIAGCFRFLQRVWRLCVDEETGTLRAAPAPDQTIEKLLHRMIAKVGGDIESLSFNTAISAMMEFVNAATGAGGASAAPALTHDQISRFMLSIAPFAPHLAEEVWSLLGNTTSVVIEAWPTVDPAMLRDDTIELPVQIQGKVRTRLMVPSGADEAAIRSLALADEKVATFLAGKTVQKVIYVPGRMVNIVAN